MNTPIRSRAAWLAVTILTLAGSAVAQREPHIGYVYPAGGRQGTSVEAVVGGQYINGAKEVLVSGEGVEVRVVKYHKPLSQGQLNQLSQKLGELSKLRAQSQTKGPAAGRAGLLLAKRTQELTLFARRLGLEDISPKSIASLRKGRNDPKKQPNPQIDETVTIQFTFSDDAEPGQRELRLKTSGGITNPIFFQVGQSAEFNETEPNNKTPDSHVPRSLPVVINGQILPGDVDRFRFHARKGMRIVAAVSARKLVPYLADAVPGWFQATLTLLDSRGKELAYTDDFRFDPDPVIYFEVPEDGEYVLEIKDSIFRGREDFVYRIALGQLPFITGVFPLGARAGTKAAVQLDGWNLPQTGLTVDAESRGPGVLPVAVSRGSRESNRVSFALDTLAETLEAEPNNDKATAHRLQAPVIVNGRVDHPGDVDVFQFTGRKGQRIVAEVRARRLGSPLDSLLKLIDPAGKLVAVNDDFPDKAAGLTTHQADSRIRAELPADGTYLLYLSDTQHKGGPDHAYRLRLGPSQPDFALRVVPSCLNARAGTIVPITVFALRKDGFDGAISLKLAGETNGFGLGGAWVPPGEEKIRLTLTVPSVARKAPVLLHMEGIATIEGREVRRLAVPAEDMMQAFLYRHLVPTDNWIVSVAGGGRRGGPTVKVLADRPVALPVGGAASVRISGPKSLFAGKVQVELNDAPKGLAVTKVTPDKEGLAIELSADKDDAKAGIRGNLIAKAFTMRTQKDKDGKPRGNPRRVELGALPAIPFVVIAPAVTKATAK